MLTLDEAITRFKALSKENRSRAESYNRGEDYELMKAKECETCADECEQVASWLEELKRYKAQKLVIKVDYNKAHSLKEMLRYAEFGVACPDSQYKVIPLVSERPQGEWIDLMTDKGYVECPFCHKQITGGDLNFCVKCGADMRGGEDK